MNQVHVMLVEDELDIADLVELHLRREGYQVDRFSTAEQALENLRIKLEKKSTSTKTEPYQLYILDWMLPGLSGVEITKYLRMKIKSEAPVLMLTARSAPGDIILGLESGADDYLQKPFEFPVLLARVRALLRRVEKFRTVKEEKEVESLATLEEVECGGIRINTKSHTVSCNGDEVLLTPSEFKLLWALANNQGRVLTRDRLIELVQGAGIAVIDRAIDTHIFGLRKKLGDCSGTIETVRGIGYRISDQK